MILFCLPKLRQILLRVAPELKENKQMKDDHFETTSAFRP